MSIEQVDNPMLCVGMPNFSSISPDMFVSALDSMIMAGESLLANISGDLPSSPCWEESIEPLLHFNMQLNRIIAIASHLESVMGDKNWRKVYMNSLKKITEFSTNWTHSKEIYDLFKSFRENEAFYKLIPERKYLINDYIRDVELEGVNLTKRKQQQLHKINSKLSETSQVFQNNVLDATDSWDQSAKRIDLKGVPQNVLENLEFDEESETFKVSLKSDVVQAVLGHARLGSLRADVYKAWTSRASEIGPFAKKFDNSKVIEKILHERHEKAKLLGFKTYAHLSLADKDANSPEEVIMFLEHIGDKAKKFALAEKDQLLSFARDELKMKTVNHWDIAYVSERMKEKLFGYSEEEISKYFPVEHVVDLLLKFASDLFGVKFQSTTALDKYHPDVKAFYALDSLGNTIGNLYLDLFARKGKKGGAWVSSFQDRADFVSESHMPGVFLVCNFSPADDYGLGLLTHNDVVTLFHEFGHALHCLLTEVKTYGVSGFSGVAWDLVEWPSQWMETWCWSKRILEDISCNVNTKDSMPLKMVDNLNQARNFQSGMHATRQIQFALLDMLIHSSEAPMSLKDAQAVHAKLASRFSVWPLYEEQRFLHAFSHIFAGGYAAGYYSYLWAEAMAADSFWSMGDQEKLDFKEVGHKFKSNVLSQGAMLRVDSAFKRMFGRPIDPDLLLVHLGLR